MEKTTQKVERQEKWKKELTKAEIGDIIIKLTREGSERQSILKSESKTFLKKMKKGIDKAKKM